MALPTLLLPLWSGHSREASWSAEGSGEGGRELSRANEGYRPHKGNQIDDEAQSRHKSRLYRGESLRDRANLRDNYVLLDLRKFRDTIDRDIFGFLKSSVSKMAWPS